MVHSSIDGRALDVDRLAQLNGSELGSCHRCARRVQYSAQLGTAGSVTASRSLSTTPTAGSTIRFHGGVAGVPGRESGRCRLLGDHPAGCPTGSTRVGGHLAQLGDEQRVDRGGRADGSGPPRRPASDPPARRGPSGAVEQRRVRRRSLGPPVPRRRGAARHGALGSRYCSSADRCRDTMAVSTCLHLPCAARPPRVGSGDLVDEVRAVAGRSVSALGRPCSAHRGGSRRRSRRRARGAAGAGERRT